MSNKGGTSVADQERNEKPTAKRRRDARKKGDVLSSKDVTTVASIITVFSTLWFHGPKMAEDLYTFFVFSIHMMQYDGVNILRDNGEMIATVMISTLIEIIALPFAINILTAVLVTMYQTKGLVTTEPLKPNFKKLNPLEGIKKLFSLKSLVDAVKNILKISVLLYIIYDFFINTVLTFTQYYYVEPFIAGADLMGHIFGLVMKIGIAFIAIAAFDYGFAWYEYEKKLKMSKQEVKDEYKQSEGDPKIKAKIKQKQFQMAQNRMMQGVPSADVIVRNPTHFAVAIRYKIGDATPVIIAMGKDHLAMRIIKVGEDNQVPIVENVPVARALYAQGEVGQPIPEEMYTAVANIILFVLKLNKQSLEDYIKPHDS